MSTHRLWRGLLSSVFSSTAVATATARATTYTTTSFFRSTTAAVLSSSIYRPSNYGFGSILGARMKHSIKTNRSAYKRFRVRGDGSLKRNKAGKSHNSGHKGRKRVTKLSQSTGIIEKKIEQRMKKLTGLGY